MPVLKHRWQILTVHNQRPSGDLWSVEVKERASLHDCINHLLAQLFQSPPPVDANTELTFSYEGYQITIY